MLELLPPKLRQTRARFAEVAAAIAPRAAAVDETCKWPDHSFDALANANLMGLTAPTHVGGLGAGLTGLLMATETLGRACSSSAICYGMHCVGTAVIAAKATLDHEGRYLEPIAQGKHITTLALSESAPGAQLYLPQTQLSSDGAGYRVNGTKQFITNGTHADSYVISTISTGNAEAGEFSCLILDKNNPGMTWLEPWAGFGMRGNASRGLQLDRAPIPRNNLLGEEGDETWYVFEVIAPYFLMAMSGTYLGVAQAALDITLDHIKHRSYAHSGRTLSQFASIQEQVAELWTALESARLLVYKAAELGDTGDHGALLPILSSKATVADTVIRLTNDAMTLCGGIAYRENSTLARLLRDARAAPVMSPTTQMLKQWAARALLDLPLL